MICLRDKITIIYPSVFQKWTIGLQNGIISFTKIVYKALVLSIFILLLIRTDLMPSKYYLLL